MKTEKLLNAIGKIDDNLIYGAVNDAKTKKKNIWIKWSAAAAFLAFVIFSVTQFIPKSNFMEELPKLPMLSISETSSEAMGFEGYMAYEISELVNANPWNENMEISTLPVYQNPLSYDENFIEHGADFTIMKTYLLEVANRLGMDTDNLPISDNTPSAEEQAAVLEKTNGDIPDGYFNPTAVIAEKNGIEIEVDASLTAKITFDPAVTLPDGYVFSYDSSYDDIASVAEYLKETYKDLLGMDNPQINIYGGDYDIDLQQSYKIEFYNAANNLTDLILNYNFNRTAFYCDENGDLYMARIFQPDLSKKVADYPIISAKEAKELLLNGNYITTVPYEMPGENYIAKRELVYRTSKHEKYYMPYYRFYVELPDMKKDNGIKLYGVYYVPAVNKAYITDMPIWDGSFNSQMAQLHGKLFRRAVLLSSSKNISLKLSIRIPHYQTYVSA